MHKELVSSKGQKRRAKCGGVRSEEDSLQTKRHREDDSHTNKLCTTSAKAKAEGLRAIA